MSMFTTEKIEVAINAASVNNEMVEISLDALTEVGGGDASSFPYPGG